MFAGVRSLHMLHFFSTCTNKLQLHTLWNAKTETHSRDHVWNDAGKH